MFLMLNDGASIFFRKLPGKSDAHKNMESVHVPPLAMRREGRNGMGEAFTAGIAFGRASGFSSEQCAYAAALFVAAHMSAPHSSKTIDPERIRRLVEERKELL
jgi:sugar/nucleoside kinase (ribokinase family)